MEDVTCRVVRRDLSLAVCQGERENGSSTSHRSSNTGSWAVYTKAMSDVSCPFSLDYSMCDFWNFNSALKFVVNHSEAIEQSEVIYLLEPDWPQRGLCAVDLL